MSIYIYYTNQNNLYIYIYVYLFTSFTIRRFVDLWYYTHLTSAGFEHSFVISHF